MEHQILTEGHTVSQSKIKRITYWIFTTLVAFELLPGTTWDFYRVNKS